MSPTTLATATARHQDCDAEGEYQSWDEARVALAIHAAHEPMCAHYLGASAYVSGSR